MANSDWDKPFEQRYLAAADALVRLEHCLRLIGLDNNINFKSLQYNFIQHGGETFNDMQREKGEGK